VLGEQRAIDVQQALLRDTRGECWGDGAFCQGQDLDILQQQSRRPGPSLSRWPTIAGSLRGNAP
jgi:hypothetical protein